MSLQLLKHCLSYEFFEQHKDTITDALFPSDIKKVYHVVEEYFKNADTDLTAKDAQNLFFAKYPAMTSSDKKNMRIFFTNLDSESTDNKQATEELLKTVKNQYYQKAAATELLDQHDGKSTDWDAVQQIIDDARKEFEVAEEEFENLTDDLVSLLEFGAEEQKWKFPIENLNEKLGGIGPGVFGLISARPNAGKTAMCISCVFHPEGWAAQGAKVALFCNEEAAFRTKKRGITCFTGVKPEEWVERKDEVTEAWNEVSGSLSVFDVVGMTLGNLEKWIDENRPDIVVVDQLDKVNVPGSANRRKDEEIRQLYTATRELAKKYDCAIVGVGQASADAEGKIYFGFDMLEHSKTGKAAECDFIITIGKATIESMGGEDTGYRMANICKNKITGNECSVPFMLNGELSRIYQ